MAKSRIAGTGSANRNALLLWLAPFIFLAIFFFYPLLTIFSISFTPGSLGVTPTPVGWDDLWRPFSFTVVQAAVSTLLTLLVGLPAAYIFGKIRFPGKAFLRVVTMLPFILPTVVVAVGFNALLGPNGWVNLVLMQLFHLSSPPVQFINTFGAILLANVFYNTTIIIRVVGDAWGRLDPHLAQVAQSLGASRWQVFRELTFPLLRPVILAAVLLVFIFDFTSFGVVLLLGGPTFQTLEVAIYIQSLQFLNLQLAAILALIQLMCTLAMTVIYARLGGGAFIPMAVGDQNSSGRVLRSGWEKVIVAAYLFLLSFLLIAPLVALFFHSIIDVQAAGGTGFTLAYYRELFINNQQSIFYVPPILAARNSLVFAAATVVITLTLGFLASYALRQRSFANRLLDPLLMLPLGASPVTLGLGFIVAFNAPPLDLRTLPILLPIAYSLVALPFVVRTLLPALASIPEHLRQSAAVLGASPLRVWLEVDMPIVARAALVSATFAFTIALGEFGATSLLARPEFPTLPIAIYRYLSLPGALNYGQSLAMSTILMLVCAAGIVLIDRVHLPGESSG